MNTLTPVSPLRRTEPELISFMIRHCQRTHAGLAVWRLPDSGVTHVILSDHCKAIGPADPFEDMREGFLMAPFDKEKNRFFLPADLLFSFQNGTLSAPSGEKEQRSQQWLADLAATAVLPPANGRVPASLASGAVQGRDHFLNLVKKGLREIAMGSFEKIVPSRRKVIDLGEDFDVAKAFGKLCEKHPHAMVSFVTIPGVGNWLGASPELLVSVTDNTTFRTVALAGTQPHVEGLPVKSVAWTQKEIEEQALVERYVISCFKKIRLREYEEHGPRTVVAGNLMHLKSEFTVDMKATNFPQLGSVMLDLLHPTSAVCGMPLAPSLEFLRQHEQYDRSFYAGYLGPVNIGNSSDLFVNLRCMQITGQQATLYAGAGITVDSIPEDEWAETEMKFDTLLNAVL